MSCNWPSLEAFTRCATQWRTVAIGAGFAFIGLDYAAVDIVLNRLSAPAHVFDDVTIMENAALPILNEAD